MKQIAIPEDEASDADECSVADIPALYYNNETGRISRQEELKENDKVEPAFPTSLDRTRAGLVAGPGAIAVPGVGGGVANQAPPLTAEQSTFLAQAELVPDSPDVEQGSNIVSDSAIVKARAQAMNESDPREPNFRDLLKLRSVRIALLVVIVVVIALAVGMAVGLSGLSNNGQTNVTTVTTVTTEDEVEGGNEVEGGDESETDDYSGS